MKESPGMNPYVILAFGVFAVSTSAVFVKLSTAPAGVIAFYRLLFSVIIMLPVFIPKYVGELKKIYKKDWLFIMMSGAFLAFHFILWFESLRYTSVASSTVLVTLQPLFAFAGAYLFFKEKFSAKAIFAAFGAIVGSFAISWGDFQISGAALYGDMLALAGCALITAYMLVGQTVRKRVSLVTYTFALYAVSSAVLLIYVLAEQQPLYPYPAADWIYFLLQAVLATLLGHTIFNWSLKWVSASAVSMAILFEPVGAALLAYVILGEKIEWYQLAGGITVILSVLYYMANDIHAQKELPKREVVREQ